MYMRRLAASLAALLPLLLAGCDGKDSRSAPAHPPAAAAEHAAPLLNLFIWSDYLAEDTLPDFERRTGIKVKVAYFDTNETLETRVLAGHSGFDVVVPSAEHFERQIAAGAYLPLDKAKLPNLKNMDPALMAKVALNDPGNAHGVIYLWASDGVGYNEKMITALLPNAPIDSWRLIFDPTVASKIAKCGINLLDSPVDVVRAALIYLGKDANSASADDLKAVETVLTRVRPYIRDFNSSGYIEGLANGDLCVALGYSGDILQARDRAREAGKGVEIRYRVPKEGSIVDFDLLAIPKDAPNPDAAHAFINYLMDPQVIANISNFKRYANGNSASLALLEPAVRDDPGIYPPAELRGRLPVISTDTPERTRAITRMWQRIKTGQKRGSAPVVRCISALSGEDEARGTRTRPTWRQHRRRRVRTRRSLSGAGLEQGSGALRTGIRARVLSVTSEEGLERRPGVCTPVDIGLSRQAIVRYVGRGLGGCVGHFARSVRLQDLATGERAHRSFGFPIDGQPVRESRWDVGGRGVLGDRRQRHNALVSV